MSSRTRAVGLALLLALAAPLAQAGPTAAALNNPPTFSAASPCGGLAAFPALSGTTSVSYSASDPDLAQSVSLSVSQLPDWASFDSEQGDPATGTISGNPSVVDFVMQLFAVLPANVTVTAEDSFGAETACDTGLVVTLLFGGEVPV